MKRNEKKVAPNDNENDLPNEIAMPSSALYLYRANCSCSDSYQVASGGQKCRVAIMGEILPAAASSKVQKVAARRSNR